MDVKLHVRQRTESQRLNIFDTIRIKAENHGHGWFADFVELIWGIKIEMLLLKRQIWVEMKRTGSERPDLTTQLVEKTISFF